MGNLQLTLQTFLAGRRGLQVADMLLQRVLHVLKGVAQLLQLVLRMDIGQRGVEITLSNAHDGIGELLQWFHHLINSPRTEYKQRRQAHDKHDGAVFHYLMRQRQRHAVTGKVEEKTYSYQKDACSNAHDTETEPCCKRLLVRQVVLVFKVGFFYQFLKLLHVETDSLLSHSLCRVVGNRNFTGMSVFSCYNQ